MLKRLAMALAITAVTLPFNAFALGLGSIELDSALNQPLNARIPLMRVRPGELKDIKINLASPETFQRAGIDYPSYLSQLQFSVVNDGNREPYIKIVSAQPITEPFLNFLLEVNWSSGRLLREFTVLVDPPVLAEGGGNRSVETPSTRDVPSARDSQVTETVVEEPTDEAAQAPDMPSEDMAAAPDAEATPSEDMAAASSEDLNAAPTEAEDRTASSRMQDEEAGSSSRSTTTTTRVVETEQDFTPSPRGASQFQDAGTVKSLPGGGAEVLTKRGDTLWNVAESMRGNSGVSVQQIMIALLRANPEAFYRNNINNLKMGYVLRLEDFEWAANISKDEAVRIADSQWEEWKQYRGSLLGSTATSTRSTQTAGVAEPRVKLLSPGEGSDEAAGAGASSSTGSSKRGSSEQLNLANEALDTSRRENTELRDRLSQVEQQVDTMERLIQLKDEQLLALQKELGKPAEQGKPAEAAKAPAAASTEPPAQEAAAVSPEAAKPEPAKPEPAKPAASKPQPAKPATTAAEKGIVETIMGVVSGLLGNFMVLAGAGGALLLVIIAWLVIRRRKMQSFQESILTGKSSLGDDSADISASEDASFMSDFAVSTMEGIHADVDEVDPLSEADVYLAYGRYKQAEELINDAMAKESKPELQMKLLEILHASKDKNTFDSKAAAFRADLAGNSDMWSQVCHWGSDLNPANPLYSGGGGGGGSAAAGDDTLADLGDFNLGSAGAENNTETFDLDMDLGLGDTGTASTDDGMGGLDFNLDSFDTTIASAPEPAAAAPMEDNTLNFDLDMNTTADTQMAQPEADSGLDFSLDLDSGGNDQDMASDNTLDFNMDMSADTGLSLGDDTESTQVADAGLDFSLDTSSEMAADDGGLSFDVADSDMSMEDNSNVVDFNSAAASEETTSFSLDDDFDADIDDSLFADVDEVGTKLDLAKAYIDMGDSDGAKSILDEVVEEGDATQKEEAKELMRQIG